MGRGGAGDLPQLAHCAHQGVNLRGLLASTSCSIEVLNAPSLRVTAWRSSGCWSIGRPSFHRWPWLPASPLKAPAPGRRQDAVDGGAGQGADGVHGQVAPQLGTRCLSECSPTLGLDAAALQAVCQASRRALWLPSGSPRMSRSPKWWAHKARRFQRATGHAPRRPARCVREWPGQSRPRVHRFKRATLRRAAHTVKEPPRHAIHGGEHNGAGPAAAQWRVPRPAGRGFHGDDHQVCTPRAAGSLWR